MKQITPKEAADLRRRHNLTQDEMSVVYGVSKKTVSFWERGVTAIPLAYYGWAAWLLDDKEGMKLAWEVSYGS